MRIGRNSLSETGLRSRHRLFSLEFDLGHENVSVIKGGHLLELHQHMEHISRVQARNLPFVTYLGVAVLE